MSPLATLSACGTKLWLDSVDPAAVEESRAYGATGATSNPSIIAGIVKSGGFDDLILSFIDQKYSDEEIAWKLADHLVSNAEESFLDVYEKTNGNDGYVSFELDPLLEDVECPLGIEERVAKYLELGKFWSEGHPNRLIKVPATPSGLSALEDLAAAGVNLNVTLIFTERQYREARDAVWRGMQRLDSTEKYKSVYSIFISRIDVYTSKNVSELSCEAQGEVGILNAKRIWKDNLEFWNDKNLDLEQEIVFASTGTKNPDDSPDKYVVALAGSDIQTNPPGTNTAIQKMEGKTFQSTVTQFPAEEIRDEIDEKVDFQRMEDMLMEEGLQKFADPQKSLLSLISEKRRALSAT